MRKTLLIAAAMIVCGALAGVSWTMLSSNAAEIAAPRPGTVTAADAASHIGQTITVEGIVSEVHVSTRATFIDLGGRYPNEEFTGVIFSSDAGAFPDVEAYEGKTVDITGTVQLYRGRPEIILRAHEQVGFPR